MKRFTKYHKKIKLVYISSAVLLCLIMVVVFPMFYEASAATGGYYVVVLNGKELGTVSGKDTVNKAMNDARLRLNAKSDSIIYVDPDLEIYKQDKLFGEKQTQKELEEKIYDVLSKSADVDKKQAYVVNIDDFTVTLASKEDVVKLFEAAKNKFDTGNQFSVDLVESSSGAFSSITYNIVKADTEAKAVKTVMSSQDSAETSQTSETAAVQDGIVGLSFDDNIEIVESYVNSDQIQDLNTAIDLVTKDTAENKIYEAKQGDCLSTIATNYDLTVADLLGMNSGLTENSVIGIGDQIVVTVPEPEISVVVQEEKTYQENYDADIQYIEDDSMYKGQSVVLSEGSQGYREVHAKITYRNGTETGREILSQTVMTESVAKVVKVGTLVPPTFVKPISGGTFSSPFGMRWGKMHEGVDWACPVGTAVNASCAGKVITAGWVSGYGYCVVIQHSDGKKTRYGHLSKILVSAGQTVDQNEKIALSGNTGDSTGPHLHFEIIVNGTPVNPLSYLN